MIQATSLAVMSEKERGSVSDLPEVGCVSCVLLFEKCIVGVCQTTARTASATSVKSLTRNLDCRLSLLHRKIR